VSSCVSFLPFFGVNVTCFFLCRSSFSCLFILEFPLYLEKLYIYYSFLPPSFPSFPFFTNTRYTPSFHPTAIATIRREGGREGRAGLLHQVSNRLNRTSDHHHHPHHTHHPRPHPLHFLLRTSYL